MGYHGTNLLSHLSSVHPNEFTLVMVKIKKLKHEEISNSSYSSSNIRINTSNTDKLLEECVNLITIHGRPFNFINDVAFQNIIQMIPSTSTHKISSTEVRNAVIMKVKLVREQLNKKLKGRLLSLKIHAATCMDRSFVEINFQYINGPKIFLNTLVVKEVYGRHTAINIKDLLHNVLLDYGISVTQIYSITTNNGANMIKLVKLIGNDQTDLNYNSVKKILSAKVQLKEVQMETVKN